MPKISAYFARISTILLLLMHTLTTQAQLTITPNQTAAQLAQKLTGAGVVVINPTLNCPTGASGIFAGISSLPIDSGIVLASGSVNNGINIGIPNPASAFASTSYNAPGDPQLTALAQVTTNDACKLEFDFIPAGDTVKFDYIFGSEEYPEYACATVNDIFGFFISGPGITGAPNIALIPGTNIPVTVNSVNQGAGAFGTLSNCTAMGPGSPFAAYYVDNSLSTTVVYDGTTTLLQAITPVTPCDTYHLKIAIADGGDWVFDSGVFLRAGSLTSNAITVASQGASTATTALPYCVRGCAPGQFKFKRQQPRPVPLTIKYQIAGTATNGVDYAQIADSVIIPANDTVATLFIQGIMQPTPSPIEDVLLRIYNPYACGSAANPSFIDSAKIDLYDSLFVEIITPDTNVCAGEIVNIVAIGDTNLVYSWTPTNNISPTNSLTPVANPTVTTTYTISASLPGSGCPPSHDDITITMKPQPIVDVGVDTTICLGMSYQIVTNVLPQPITYNYSWSPAAGLSSTSIANPIATPSVTTQYVVTVNSGAVGCDGYDTLNIRVLPNTIQLLNQDTAICKGGSVQIRLIGDPAFTYAWSPTQGVVLPNQSNPVITPDTSRRYTVTASYPGCTNMTQSFFIDVQPIPLVDAGPDRFMCERDTIIIQPTILPTWYTNYSYSWAAPTNVKPSATNRDIYFDGTADETLTLTVTTPAGCSGTDALNIKVYPSDFITVDPVSANICPGDSVLATLQGGDTYHWSPNYHVSDTNGASVYLSPLSSTTYMVYGTNSFGCRDTTTLPIRVFENGLISLADSIVIYPGESVQLDPLGNCLYFTWFPQNYLSNASIANPIATPPVNTRYYVSAKTENGCDVRDSIDIIVDPTEYLELPNAFSPGSEPNSNFTIIRRGLATLKYFRIFNRWGQEVFSTTNIDQGWDGQFKGTPQPMGVYIWTVEAKTNTGVAIKKQGNVTLIR